VGEPTTEAGKALRSNALETVDAAGMVVLPYSLAELDAAILAIEAEARADFENGFLLAQDRADRAERQIAVLREALADLALDHGYIGDGKPVGSWKSCLCPAHEKARSLLVTQAGRKEPDRG
jgi:hypothetical protein